MAGRPAKAKVEEVNVEETNTGVSNDILQELMKQMAEMKAKLEDKDKENSDLQTLISALKDSKSDTSDDKLLLEDEIEVISQFGGELTLYTQGNNAGTPYKFAEYGDVWSIPFGDLKDIVRVNPVFMKNLDFYINNEKAVKQLKIEHFYKSALSHEDMFSFFDKDLSDMEKCYERANIGQKNTILALTTSKIRNNETISLDAVQLLSRLSGKPLMGMLS